MEIKEGMNIHLEDILSIFIRNVILKQYNYILSYFLMSL